MGRFKSRFSLLGSLFIGDARFGEGVRGERCVKGGGHLLFLRRRLFLLFHLLQLGFLLSYKREQVFIFAVKDVCDRGESLLVQIWVHKAEPSVSRECLEVFDRTDE